MSARGLAADRERMGRSPRILVALAALLVVAILPSPGSAGPRGKTAQVAQLQAALLSQINSFRAAHGLVSLKVSGGLTGAADAHSAQMARLGFFSHNSANGQSFSQRLAQVYSPRGFRSWTVGENLVWGGPDIGAARAFRLWLSSPPHRANLLNARWREVGLGAVHSTSAPGVYGGGAATIVTADFGARTR
jgi:uncharacterized protein YkwD